MTLSLDKEYETVNGETVELRHVIGGVKHLRPAFVGVYWDRSGVPYLGIWDMDGKPVNCRAPSIYEKREVQKRTVWLNINEDATSQGVWYATKEQAGICATPHRIACVKVDLEFKEGDGIE